MAIEGSDDHDPNRSRDHLHPAVADFAERLRRLRADAGSPSFRKLAKLTHYSSSTCAEATAGRRLPTESVVKAFVTACGADPAEWLALHRKASDAFGRPEPAPTSAQGPPPEDSGTRWSTTAMLVAVGVTLAAGVAAGVGGTKLLSGATPSTAVTAPAVPVPVPVFTLTPGPAPTARVADGADPTEAGCTADARLVDKSPVMMDGVQVGALELLYSPYCGAGWARVYLYPGQSTMLGSVTVATDDQRSAGFADPLVKQVPDYTNVVVPAPGGCLSARAEVFSTGKQPAEASIQCQAPIAP